jgi:hypothetical protein
LFKATAAASILAVAVVNRISVVALLIAAAIVTVSH